MDKYAAFDQGYLLGLAELGLYKDAGIGTTIAGGFGKVKSLFSRTPAAAGGVAGKLPSNTPTLIGRPPVPGAGAGAGATAGTTPAAKTGMGWKGKAAIGAGLVGAGAGGMLLGQEALRAHNPKRMAGWETQGSNNAMQFY